MEESAKNALLIWCSLLHFARLGASTYRVSRAYADNRKCNSCDVSYVKVVGQEAFPSKCFFTCHLQGCTKTYDCLARCQCGSLLGC